MLAPLSPKGGWVTFTHPKGDKGECRVTHSPLGDKGDKGGWVSE